MQKMRFSTILCCVLYLLRAVIKCDICDARYFKLFEGHRLIAASLERAVVEHTIMCFLLCTNIKERCQAINVIKTNNETRRCELYSEEGIRSGHIMNDESSLYVVSMQIEENRNTTHKSASISSEPVDTSTSMTSSVIINISPTSTVPLSMTSSITDISPTSTVPLSVSSSVTDISPTSTVPLSVSSSVTSGIAAVACKKIYQDNRASPDGRYTIFAGTSKETQVFCDMTGSSTGCNGGGWTLVMRINGQQQTFSYSSNLWTNKEDLNTNDGHTLDSNKETKLSTYHTTPFTQICLGMKYNNQKGWTTISLSSSSLFDLISSNSYQGTNLAVSQWTGLIPSGTSLQSNCRVQGINVVRGDTGVRIGIIATKTCEVNGDYNSRLGFGAKGTSCGQDGNNRCGNDARCDAVPNALSKKTMGYILVK